MVEKKKLYKHLSGLISQSRQKKGWLTLKQLYRDESPDVDYTTWRHVESGRRIPHPESLLKIARILGIPKESLLIAYCKDKFADDDCHNIVDSFLYRKFIDVDALFEVHHHNQITHLFTKEQIEAMKEDVRIRMFLNYTYDKNLQTNFERLAQFFNMESDDVKLIVAKLEELDLVDVDEDVITLRHRHMAIPPNTEVFELRRNLLLFGLEQNLKPDSHISNFHVNVSEASLKKIMAFIFFAEANFLKLTKEDHINDDKSISQVQIAIAVNKIGGLVDDQSR